jgi:hypothetical protein
LAIDRVALIEKAGFRVDAPPLKPSGGAKQLRVNLPQLFVIDLDRLPSHGREIGVWLRQSAATRHIPLVFAGGAPEKVEPIRKELPDAVYTGWSSAAALKKVLRQAMKDRPIAPIQPSSHMQRYAGSSLVKKLGLPRDSDTALIAAPGDFPETLGDIPDGCRLQTRITPQSRLVVWFVRSRRELEAAVEQLCLQLRSGASAWIAHPKQTSRYRADFNQNDVRAVALAMGLVDYKVCAIDADWSGLKFARKK